MTMNENKKLGIGLPLGFDFISKAFFISWALMEKPDYTLYLPKYPGRIEDMRNQIAMSAMEDGMGHLIMMDTDQIYPADTVIKLLSHKKMAVGAVVHRRYPPFDPILYRGNLHKYYHVPDTECYSGDLVEVDATGCGCICYDMEVFNIIRYPWFEMDIDVENSGKPVGEDIGFCHKLKQAGVRIFMDTSIQIGHMTTFEVTKETYFLFKKLKRFEWATPETES